MQQNIKTYKQVNAENHKISFGIKRMQDIYAERNGQADEPHRHNYYIILLTQKAAGKHFIDFTEYPFEANQVVCIRPGQVHQIIETAPSEGFSMVFSEEFLLENNIECGFIDTLNLFNDYGSTPPLKINQQQKSKLLNICQQIEEYHKAGHKFSYAAIGALIKLFLIECNQICSLHPKPLNNQHQETAYPVLEKFKSLINAQYKTWHLTSQYAEAMHISPDYLNRIVKQLTGKTAKDFILSRLTVAAKRLLYFTDLNTKEIAFELGFSEPANFSHFFKKQTGEAPSNFRLNKN